MTKQIQIRATGDTAALEIVTRPPEALGPGMVQVTQEAIGINFVDVMVRRGIYPMALPAVLGFEAAGTVKAVGSGVTAFAPGDRVAYFFVAGAYATSSVVPSEALVHLPDDIGTDVAATFLAKGLTAWMALRAMHDVVPGDIVLVLGASGSVGSILTRWARSIGATVIGVAGSRNKLSKVEAGSSHAVLASDPDVLSKIRAIAPDGVDVVYDFVGQATINLGVTAVRDGGLIATIGAASGQPRIESDLLRSRGIRLVGGGTPQYVRGDTISVATNELWGAIRADIFDDIDVVRYPFDAIANAHADMDSRRLSGLPVLIP